MDPSKKERWVELVGAARPRRRALKLIMRMASFVRDDSGKVLKDPSSTPADAGPGVQTCTLQIRCDEVGRILGRGGENIRRIEEDCGARLEMVDRSEGRLEIRGAPDAVARARERVLCEVSHARDGSGAVIKDGAFQSAPGMMMRPPAPGLLPPGGPLPGGGGAAPSGGGSGLKLWVYSKEAGRIIGRGGETVRELMQRTGAEIQVQRSDGSEQGTSERLIQVFGNQTQQEEVCASILRDITYCRGENGVLKSPDMTPREVEDRARGLVGPCAGGPALLPGGGAVPGAGMPPPPWMGGAQGPMGGPMMMPGMMPGMLPGMMPGMPGMPAMPGMPGGLPPGGPPPPGAAACQPGSNGMPVLPPGMLPPPGMCPPGMLPPPGMCPPGVVPAPGGMPGAPSLPAEGGQKAFEQQRKKERSRSSSSSSSDSGGNGRASRRRKGRGGRGGPEAGAQGPSPWQEKQIDWDEL